MTSPVQELQSTASTSGAKWEDVALDGTRLFGGLSPDVQLAIIGAVVVIVLMFIVYKIRTERIRNEGKTTPAEVLLQAISAAAAASVGNHDIMARILEQVSNSVRDINRLSERIMTLQSQVNSPEGLTGGISGLKMSLQLCVERLDALEKHYVHIGEIILESQSRTESSQNRQYEDIFQLKVSRDPGDGSTGQ